MRQNLIVNIFAVLYVIGALTASITYDIENPEALIAPLLLFPLLNIVSIVTKYGSKETGVIYVTKVDRNNRTVRLELNETPEDFEKRSEVIFLVRKPKKFENAEKTRSIVKDTPTL